jgi:intein-encoded DNA endonuclease-like protein
VYKYCSEFRHLKKREKAPWFQNKYSPALKIKQNNLSYLDVRVYRQSAPLYIHRGSVQAVRPIGGVEV